jgi:hypothetical protein
MLMVPVTLQVLYFKKRAIELLHAQRQFKALGEILRIAQAASLRTDKGSQTGERRPRILFLGGGTVGMYL